MKLVLIIFLKEMMKGPGDLIYYQGHSSPGIYARSFLEGRLTKRILIILEKKLMAMVCHHTHIHG